MLSLVGLLRRHRRREASRRGRGAWCAGEASRRGRGSKKRRRGVGRRGARLFSRACSLYSAASLWICPCPEFSHSSAAACLRFASWGCCQRIIHWCHFHSSRGLHCSAHSCHAAASRAHSRAYGCSCGGGTHNYLEYIYNCKVISHVIRFFNESSGGCCLLLVGERGGGGAVAGGASAAPSSAW